MRRLVFSLLVLVIAAPALAQEEPERRLEVVDISGPLDGLAVGFIIDSIRDASESEAVAVILQIDSPGVVADGDRFDELTELIAAPPLPVAVWVGPDPAVAYGGVVDLLAGAQIRLAAPGVILGHAEPTFIAGDGATVVPELADSVVTVDAPIEGLVDVVTPAIREAIAGLDGRTVAVGGAQSQLSTASTEDDTLSVVLHKPGPWTRFVRLAMTPEATLMFLLAGLTVAAFEFYAIGPGLAAGVASISLFLSGYGLAVLPVRWWALALVLGGWALLTVSYQRGSVAALTVLGALVTAAGGLWFVDGAPQLAMGPVVTLVLVAAIVAFYTVAMPTVARARFSTRTIGRDRLVGRQGRALVDFEPDGEVDVDGARWRATAHREAGITAGSTVRVNEVDGLVLLVEPFPQSEREN